MNAATNQSPRETAGLTASEWRSILQEQSLLFDVISDSMAPTFRAGERVLIRPLLDDEPKRGQVIAFFRGGLVTHRYVGSGILLGDNAPYPDQPIEPEALVGVVVSVERDGRLKTLSMRAPFWSTFKRVRTRVLRRYP